MLDTIARIVRQRRKELNAFGGERGEALMNERTRLRVIITFVKDY